MRCGYCGSKFHTIENCPKTYTGSVNRDRMRCTYCGGKDHLIEACPKTYSGNAVRAFNPDSVEDYFVKDKVR